MTVTEKSLITFIKGINEGKLTFADWREELDFLASQIGKKIVVDQVDEIVSDEMTKRELISTTVFCSHYGNDFIFFKVCDIIKEIDYLDNEVSFGMIIYNDIATIVKQYKTLKSAQNFIAVFKSVNIHIFEK